LSLTWFILAQGAKRCHDIGKSGWWQFIPFYPFFLMFEKGQEGKNKYDEIETLDDSKIDFAITKPNIRIILIGLAVNILGYLLMIGGGSDDPAKFDANELFSTTRITVAPILIVLGFGIIIYGIMKKNKSSKSEE
jgi:uncharacterized membrane protein YhaH (DUF805 family)